MSVTSGAWHKVRIKHVARLTYGLGQPPPLNEVGIPILRATNIVRGKINPVGLIYADKDDLPLDRAPLLKAGEILVVRSGAYTGDSALVTEEWAGSVPGYDLRLTPTNVHSGYLAYCLLSSSVMEQVDIAKSRAAQPHLNADELGEVVINVPSVEEQRRIANFLDAETARLDRVQDCAVRQTSLLKIRRRSFIESVVDEAVVDPETVALRYIIRPSFESNRSDLQVLSVYRDYGVIPKDSRQDNFNKTPEDVSRYLVVRGGDLVVNKMKAWQGSLGISIHKGIVSPDYLVARITTANVHREFLHYLLRSPRFTAEYAIRSKGIRPSQWRLYWEDLAQVRIPIVPLQKQIGIVRRLKHEDAWVEGSLSAIHRRLDLLAERWQALITAVVTGQIDVSTASGRGVDIG